jgi:type IV pilus assembly protein PilC
MATAKPQENEASDVKEHLFSGRARTRPATSSAAKCAQPPKRRLRPRCGARHSGHQDSQAALQKRRQDHRQGHHAVHAPAGNHDEGRRAAAAGLRHRWSGHSNPSVGKLLLDIKADVETGSSLSQAFRKYPLLFRCVVLQPGRRRRTGRHSGNLLDRLATYKEKMPRHQEQDQVGAVLSDAIIVVAFIITAVIMIFVIPAFKEVFKSFGADLPAPTAHRDHMSDFFVEYWWLIFGSIGGGIYALLLSLEALGSYANRLRPPFACAPIFGDIIRKSVIARWTRTLATMFAAGVPLVESLDSVGGAAGNYVYKMATKQIQNEVSTGTSLTSAMQNTKLFDNMVNADGGDRRGIRRARSHAGKVADFLRSRSRRCRRSPVQPDGADDHGRSRVLIGGMVIAMYLPIFKLGSVVG